MKGQIQDYAWNVKRKMCHTLVDNIQYNSVLDVGCRNGDQLIAKYVKKGVFGCGLDMNKIGDRNTQNIQFIRGDAQKLPFKDKVFDLVTATEVIEHLPDHNSFLREIHRVSKKNGFLILSTVNLSCISVLIGWRVIRFLKGIFRHEHVSEITPMKLKRELADSGFTVVSLDYGAFDPYIFPRRLENKLLIKVYLVIDKITNFKMLKMLTKWDMIIKAVREDEY